MRWSLAALLGVMVLLVGCQLRPMVPARPDRIAFMTDRDGNFAIYIMEKNGSNPTRLTSAEQMNSGLPDWSAQARAFVFLNDQGAGALAISRMDDRGQNVTLLVAEPPPNAGPPVWSPTGEWLAFGSGAQIQNSDVLLVNAMGEQLINLTDHPAQDRFEAWSPDGQQLVLMAARLPG